VVEKVDEWEFDDERDRKGFLDQERKGGKKE